MVIILDDLKMYKHLYFKTLGATDNVDIWYYRVSTKEDD